MGIKIKDAQLVEQITGNEKIPVSDGSGSPKAVTTEQLKDYIGAKEGDSNVQGESSIELLANGNIKVTINGVSKDFMPATPSGDPMHYMYKITGAEYNDTGSDIIRTGVYGDTIIWKAGYWWLNELGDITNDEMRKIYAYAYTKIEPNTLVSYWSRNKKVRTNASFDTSVGAAGHEESSTYFSTNIETVGYTNSTMNGINGILISNLLDTFRNSYNLKKILNIVNLQYLTSSQNIRVPFVGCNSLQEVRIKHLKFSIEFAQSSELSKESVLYLIQNETATGQITVTLHADAYSRLSTDTDIIAALENHPLISLASA